MNILIAVASKHGSTHEIAEAIAEELRSVGHTVSVQDAKQTASFDGVDAVLVGSAVYAGKWLPDALRFVEHNREQLATIPTWLFSSGPLGEAEPETAGNPVNLEELMAETQAQGHKVFVGKLDKDDTSLAERLIVRMVKAPYGDFRDWDAVRSWAREIATAVDIVPAD